MNLSNGFFLFYRQIFFLNSENMFNKFPAEKIYRINTPQKKYARYFGRKKMIALLNENNSVIKYYYQCVKNYLFFKLVKYSKYLGAYKSGFVIHLKISDEISVNNFN